MYEDPGMVGFRKLAFISSGIETLLSSCNLIQTGLFVELNRTPLLIAANGWNSLMHVYQPKIDDLNKY